MTSNLHTGSDQFIAYYNNNPVGFCAVLHFPHPNVSNFKRLHRLVILPDYQGLKIGATLSDFVSQYYKDKGFRVIVTTSNPVTIKHRLESKKWVLTRKGHAMPGSKSSFKKISSVKKITMSLEYVGDHGN